MANNTKLSILCLYHLLNLQHCTLVQKHAIANEPLLGKKIKYYVSTGAVF